MLWSAQARSTRRGTSSRQTTSGSAILPISQIIADTMDEMGLKLPPTQVDIADIRRKYHAAEREEKGGGKRGRRTPAKAG